MKVIQTTLPQPRYKVLSEEEAKVNGLTLLVGATYKGCNIMVVCKGTHPSASVEIPRMIDNVSVGGFVSSTLGKFTDPSHISQVIEGAEKDSIIVELEFNKMPDFVATNNASEIEAELNNEKVKWTTEMILREVLVFTDALVIY